MVKSLSNSVNNEEGSSVFNSDKASSSVRSDFKVDT